MPGPEVFRPSVGTVGWRTPRTGRARLTDLEPCHRQVDTSVFPDLRG